MTTSDGVSSSGLYGFKNRILNGQMVIDQRNAGASVTLGSGNTYILDRWECSASVASKFSAQQSSTAPTGFINSTLYTSLSAYTVGAGEIFTFRQKIEGLNIADLAWGTASASTVTLSFWVRSSLTGTFGGALNNSGFARSYPFTYTISSANTWEQKTLTIAGDTSGTWLTTNGVGLNVNFGLGCSSSNSGTAGSWSSNDYRSATGATSVVGTNGATFYITGVQLEKGSTATSFDYRPYGTELQLCQRYYYKQQAVDGDAFFGSGYVVAATAFNAFISFPVPMRTKPTALEQSGTAGDYRIVHAATSTTCSAIPTYESASIWSARVPFTVASGLTTGQAGMARSVNSSAYLGFSAEL
jgi:hypothetical protein